MRMVRVYEQLSRFVPLGFRPGPKNCTWTYGPHVFRPLLGMRSGV